MSNEEKFVKYFYGDIDPVQKILSKHIESAILEAKSILGREVDFLDFYRALSYNSIQMINTIIVEGEISEEETRAITVNANKIVENFLKEKDYKFKREELFMLPHVMADVIAFQFWSRSEEENAK